MSVTAVKHGRVCHGCKRYYHAIDARHTYDERTLYDLRKGINLTLNELPYLKDLIPPLVLKGQPLSHIFAVHTDEIPVCRRTLYKYFDQSILSLAIYRTRLEDTLRLFNVVIDEFMRKRNSL